MLILKKWRQCRVNCRTLTFKLWSGSIPSFSHLSDCPCLAVIHRWQMICNQRGIGLTGYIKSHDFSHPFFALRSTNWLLLSYSYMKLNASSKWGKVISRFFSLESQLFSSIGPKCVYIIRELVTNHIHFYSSCWSQVL